MVGLGLGEIRWAAQMIWLCCRFGWAGFELWMGLEIGMSIRLGSSMFFIVDLFGLDLLELGLTCSWVGDLAGLGLTFGWVGGLVG